MKRVFLVHGWDGTPEHGWFPWLTRELEARGFQVIAPQLPDTATPHLEKWVPALADAVGTADRDTYFVGHSMGCQTVARYLMTLLPGAQVGGVVYVAGFFERLVLGTGEEESVWNSWRTVPVDFSKIQACAPRSVAIFSDNDSYVPLDNVENFENELGAEIHIEHKQDHFSGDQGYTELPLVLESVLKLAHH